MEKLTNLDQLPSDGVTISCFPVKLGDASAPGRASSAYWTPECEKREVHHETRRLHNRLGQVVDGDTVRIDGMRIRLHGIDAPDGDRMYKANGNVLNTDGKGRLLAGFMVLASSETVVIVAARPRAEQGGGDGRQ